MLAWQARANAALAATFGEVSTLDGLDVGKVALQYGVAVDVGSAASPDDSYTVPHDIASILSEHAPKIGGVLVHPDGRFLLDSLIGDNGGLRRFVVVRLPALP